MSKDLIFQTTIKNEFQYKGAALHSGKETSIRCLPLEADVGIVFRRTDFKAYPIKACPQNVRSTIRCTSIGMGDSGNVVHGIEHLLSAFSMLGIDNVLVEIDGDEVPVGDGSALLFINRIKECGTLKLDKPANIVKIASPLFTKDKDMVLIALPCKQFRISYTLSYNHPYVGTQFGDFVLGGENALKEIAPARTFGFEEELDELKNKGLALGGSLESVVFITKDGPVNELRFHDELVRHKVLDMVGDLYLNGRVEGHFIGIKSGHTTNVEMTRLILGGE